MYNGSWANAPTSLNLPALCRHCPQLGQREPTAAVVADPTEPVLNADLMGGLA
jgi:hypothetical protein